MMRPTLASGPLSLLLACSLGGCAPDSGSGGNVGSGGSAAGSGGSSGASDGGATGSGGATPGSGGALPGSGGATPGSGGALPGSGGAVGPGGAVATGGSATGGRGTGGRGTGGAAATGGAGGARDAGPFILGADISWVQEDEARGVRFRDNGTQKDILQILKDHGFNYIRLRTFQNPRAAGGYSAQGYCDLPHTIQMGKRVKDAGMGFLLDFHYSDNWADPGKQVKPAAWAQLSFADLVTAVHDYTKDAITQLVAGGARPDMVQVGNEITPGMLLPDGSNSSSFTNLGMLLKAGIAGVREVDPAIKIMLHIDRGGNNQTSRWWFDGVIAQGVSFDVIGQSCYTEFQGPPSGWQANFADLVTRYPNHQIAIAEYSFEKRAANDIVFNLPGRRGVGTFIWEPTRWMERIFDGQGNSIPAQIGAYDEMASAYGLR
jgi:arabinogalactan endo-1,4-beta-galactosidase